MSGSMRVLHVDDDPDFTEVAATFLEREDDRIEVVTETNAGDGLDRLAAEDIDCIISDYDMPGMDGLAFLNAVRDSYPTLPFILFTGKGSEEVASDALSVGATEYLRKDGGTDQYTPLANRVLNAIEAAQANRQRQRQLDAIETAREGISILDGDGEFIFVNEAYADLYGYEPADLIGEHWERLYPDDDIVHIHEDILPTVEEEGRWRGETTGLRADGSTFVEDHSLALTDDSDLICTIRDITERKQHTQALQRERAFTQGALDALPDPLYAIDESGSFLRWNDRLAEVTGYSDDEIAGMAPTDFFAGEDVERIAAAIDRVFTDGHATVEADLVTKDGDAIPYEFNGALMRAADGTVLGLVGTGGDIIDRNAREQQLQTERDRLAALFESVPEPVARVRFDDGTPRVQAVNTAFETTFGITATEATGESLNDLIVPAEYRDGAEDIDTNVLKGDPVEREVRRQAAEGLRDFLFRSVPVERPTDDTALEQFGVYIDITEQKERERELARYEEMLNRAGDIVYATDPDGYLTAVNDAAVSFLGYDREELVGAHVSKVMAEENIATGEALIRELLADPAQSQGTFEMALETVSGEWIQCEDHIHILVEDGEFHGTVGVVRDITERKERERTLEALHEATRALIAGETPAEVAEIAIDAASDILDHDVNSIHLYDEDAGGLVPTAVTDATRDLLGAVPTFTAGTSIAWRVFETGEPFITDDVRTDPDVHDPESPIRSEMILPLGDHGVLIFASPTVDVFDDADVALAQLLAANVEAALGQVGREVELRRRTRELERQNGRLDEFASVVSHDLPNPLTVAAGRARLAAGECDSEHLDPLSQALDRMNALIGNLLTLARQGRAVGETSTITVGRIAEAAWNNVKTGEASLEVATDRSIEADESRLRQLFENLFRNAIEHAGETCTVRIGGLSDPPGISIEDDGPGIPADEREAVFESGYSTTAEGTGFGLAIVEEIAEAHGWTIGVGRGDLGGARFEIQDTSRD